ncbi:hypothetical protein PG991_006829 [Apiospora marii]|uniref:protein-ribulosamine 3-kinase n=1 Tax=Apiospora marii TaxID=335849 RepID=A0ABR1RYL2_9PEZI
MDENLDPAIFAVHGFWLRLLLTSVIVLPAGCEVISINPHGKGSWSAGYKLDILIGNDKEEEPQHADLAKGEFESQTELHKYIPDNVAIPLAYGALVTDPTSSFFLTPFLDLSEKTPEPAQLVEVLQKLHKTSSSPTGKFGFHIPTFNGIVPLVNEWCDTWEEYFARQLRSDIEWEHSIRGPDPEFDATAEEFFEKVIPRLLRPLQTGGRSIKPVLVHGDIWPGNVQIDMATQRVILFDSCCCYGHNELDLGMMREPRYRFTGDHANKYLEVVRPSEPVGDFDDRNAIYAMVKEEMQRLIAKHPTGIDGFNEVAISQSSETKPQ